MLKFILSRLLQGFLIIWGIVSLLFIIFYTLGDPVSYLVEDKADEATREAIRVKYGLDKPLAMQYLHYLNQLSPVGILDEETSQEIAHLSILTFGQHTFALKAPGFGRSYQTNRPVGEMLTTRMEGTLVLALSAMAIAALLGVFMGVVAALLQGSWWDKGILTISVMGISAPSFFMGVLIAWLFAVKWRDFTGLNATGYLYEDNIFEAGRHLVLRNLFLPALALGIRPLAVFIQLTRSSMIDVLNSDYIRTARAKGLNPPSVIFRHALRNALNPVMTSVTGWLASLLAGAFFIEYIFNWQGIGKLTIDALNTKDFPVILGCAIFIGLIFVLVSIITDMLYAVLDPRVRLNR